MVISAFSFCASSGRPPARYCAAESLRCLIIELITARTSESSRGFAFSISRYFIWLLSIRSVPRRRASLARAAVFISESIWSESICLDDPRTRSEYLSYDLRTERSECFAIRELWKARAREDSSEPLTSLGDTIAWCPLEGWV